MDCKHGPIKISFLLTHLSKLLLLKRVKRQRVELEEARKKRKEYNEQVCSLKHFIS